MNDTRLNGCAATGIHRVQRQPSSNGHRPVLTGWEGAREVKARRRHTNGQRPVRLIERRPVATPEHVQVDYRALIDPGTTDREYRVHSAMLSAAWMVTKDGKTKRNPCTLTPAEIGARAGGKSVSQTREIIRSLVEKEIWRASWSGKRKIYWLRRGYRESGNLAGKLVTGNPVSNDAGNPVSNDAGFPATEVEEGEVEEHEVEKIPQTPQSGAAGKITRRKTPRENGTGPRAQGTNSRALGTNPRAQGTNPRNGNPYCGIVDCNCYNKHMMVVRHGQDWEARKEFERERKKQTRSHASGYFMGQMGHDNAQGTGPDGITLNIKEYREKWGCNPWDQVSNDP